MRKKILLVLFGFCLSLLAIQVSINYFIDRKGGKKVQQTLPNSTGVYTLPRINVSLGSSDKKPGAVRIVIDLEVSAEDSKKLATYEPLIMDRVHETLKHLTVDEIKELPELKGFRDELLWELNQICSPIPIYKIRFRELIVT